MTSHLASAHVLFFWFGEGADYGKRHKRWFEKDASFDAAVRSRFLALYEELAAGAQRAWLQHPADCLARILVLDQFPRNMFRGTARAFATDDMALASCRHALACGYDARMLPVEKLFLYLPLEHSEVLADQRQACALMQPLAAYPETADAYEYAVLHHDIVQRFGRFPHRNAILGRESTPEELEFLRQPRSSF
jgi:uncharacterized protein (DUF924 family)